jgi:acetyl esterase/lipase
MPARSARASWASPTSSAALPAAGPHHQRQRQALGHRQADAAPVDGRELRQRLCARPACTRRPAGVAQQPGRRDRRPHGIAPALVIPPEFNRLHAEGQRYAQRLQKAGALVECRDVPQVNASSLGVGPALATNWPVTSRNRRVVGSNPTSGSETAGQSVCAAAASLALLASLILRCARTWRPGGPPRFAT